MTVSFWTLLMRGQSWLSIHQEAQLVNSSLRLSTRQVKGFSLLISSRAKEGWTGNTNAGACIALHTCRLQLGLTGLEGISMALMWDQMPCTPQYVLGKKSHKSGKWQCLEGTWVSPEDKVSKPQLRAWNPANVHFSGHKLHTTIPCWPVLRHNSPPTFIHKLLHSRNCIREKVLALDNLEPVCNREIQSGDVSS